MLKRRNSCSFSGPPAAL